ncbi:choline transporter-like protein 1 isoform X1 [Girardinichthys multiradiatus]|uniref:choline transporter-like protein 1 isoform X1 n=2 Tax=Girardinichthys multiradiatus TaxID=208333 RepID=UPI001FAD5115|nr:choline transporter-like protein 1 isoform X1 [Girardinichthys multiradiatus]
MGCCSSAEGKRDWKPLEEHSCTDIPWLIIFTLFCIGMAFICGFAIATGGSSRLVSGYDSYGNTCGRNNTDKKIDGVPFSGADMTEKKYVFFLEPCNLDLINRKIKSIALCVFKCPATELTTYKEVKDFALSNGSHLCSYDITPTRYESSSDRHTKCPKLPVPASKAAPIFHRCIPTDIGCYAEFAQAFMTFVSDNTVLRRVVAGVLTSKEIIMGLCVLALVLSLIMMVIIRYISKLLVYILTVLVIVGSVGGSGILWWLYADHRFALSSNGTTVFGKEVAADNGKALLVYAIGATIFTVVLLLVMFFMRKRVALTISLFHVAGKVFIHLPLLVLQPFWTFLSLMFFWVYWIAVLLFLGTTGSPIVNDSTGVVEYEMQGPLQYMVWYHLVGLIWISEFILAFQQMTIAGAVITYYFTRNKSQMPATPVINSMFRTIRYHLGTLAKGSFIITLVKIPRLILTYIHNQLKGKENACARCMLKACVCCLWCLEKCLAYLNQNAYTATAINSTNFCTSAREALLILVENALRVAAINTVGDFVLFMGKVLIVSCTAFAGILALNYQRDYTVWVLPLLIACLFAFLVAHCFLSVFENVVDVLFLCFAVDSKYNDGSPGREYYMDKTLMEFVENSKKMGQYNPQEGDGREMKPMTRGGASA